MENEAKKYRAFERLAYDSKELKKTALPKNAAGFLARKGLPVLSSSYWLEYVTFYDQKRILNTPEKCGMTVIGELYEIHSIAVGKKGVYLIDETPAEDGRPAVYCGLMNSSLRKMNRFMEIYYNTVRANHDLLMAEDEDTARAVCSQLERRFLAADPAAMEDENGFWPLRIEELSYIYI